MPKLGDVGQGGRCYGLEFEPGDYIYSFYSIRSNADPLLTPRTTKVRTGGVTWPPLQRVSRGRNP